MKEGSETPVRCKKVRKGSFISIFSLLFSEFASERTMKCY